MGEVERINGRGAARFLEEMVSAYEHARGRDAGRAYDAYYKDFGVWREVLGGAEPEDGAAAAPPSA